MGDFICQYSLHSGLGETSVKLRRIALSVYFKRGGVPPRSNEISAKTRNVGPLKYTLMAPLKCASDFQSSVHVCFSYIHLQTACKQQMPNPQLSTNNMFTQNDLRREGAWKRHTHEWLSLCPLSGQKCTIPSICVFHAAIQNDRCRELLHEPHQARADPEGCPHCHLAVLPSRTRSLQPSSYAFLSVVVR